MAISSRLPTIYQTIINLVYLIESSLHNELGFISILQMRKSGFLKLNKLPKLTQLLNQIFVLA